MNKKTPGGRKPQPKSAKKPGKSGELSSTPYDDAWRTLTTNLPNLLIPMVNEVFGESFTNQAIRVEKSLFPPTSKNI